MKTSDYKSFNYLENGEILFSEYETIKSAKTLDSGSYRVDYIGYPHYKVILKLDKNIESSKTYMYPEKQQLDELFESFFNSENLKKIESLGFCHKFGVLLYGKEGTGKSSIIKHYSDLAIKEHNALVFHMVFNGTEFSQCWNFIQAVRDIQDNPIIVVFDEFDQQMEKNEAFLKTVIDGNMSISNCIFFAATNYIDRIPTAMSERPSRFKYSINIKGIESQADVKEVIQYFLKDMINDKEINSIAKELVGETLDVIKNHCVDKIMNLQHYGKNRKKIGLIK